MRAVRPFLATLSLCVFVCGTIAVALSQGAPHSATRRAPEIVRRTAVSPSFAPMTMAPLLQNELTAHGLKPIPKPRFAKGQHRSLLSASGASIALSGIVADCYSSTGADANTTVLAVSTSGTPCSATWTSSNLGREYTTPQTHSFQDYVLAPGMTAPTAVGTTYSGTTNAPGHAQNFTQAGVYVFGVYDTATQDWVALLYVEVSPALALLTYSDSSYSTLQETYTLGNTVYIKATGLTPNHGYAIGIENTSESGQCVWIAPNNPPLTSLTSGPTGGGATGSHLCDFSVTNISTGMNAAGSNALNFPWVTFNGTITNFNNSYPVTMKPGTYTVVLFDATNGVRVRQRQISFVGTNAMTTGEPWVRFFANGGTTLATGDSAVGPNAATQLRVAWNGTNGLYADSNVTAVSVGMGAFYISNVGPAYSYRLTLSNPNGTVGGTTCGTTAVCAGALAKDLTGATSFAPTGVQAGLPNPTVDFNKNYANANWTVSLYQVGNSSASIAPTLLASRTAQVLSYSSSIIFTGTPAAPLNTTSINISNGFFVWGGSGQTGIKYTNTGDSVFGVGNSDPIKEFQTTIPSGWYQVTIATATGGTCIPNQTGPAQPCIETVNDSAGNPWTVTLSCSAVATCGTLFGRPSYSYTLDAVPANGAAQSLIAGANLDVEGLTFTAPLSGAAPCKTGCTLPTSIYPRDGFGLSGGNKVANDLQFTNTTNANVTYNTTAHITYLGYRPPVASGAPSALTSTKLPPGYTTRNGQAVLSRDQPFSQGGNNLVFAMPITDANVAGGNSDSISGIAIVLPSGFNPSAAQVRDSLTSATILNSNANCAGAAQPPALCVKLTTPLAASTNPNETLYIDVPPPAQSFSWTDLTAVVYISSSANGNYAINPDNTAVTTPAGNPGTVDSLAIAAYSLSGAEITAVLSPNQLQANNAGSSVTFQLQNTTTALDPNPDYLDMVAFTIQRNSPSSVTGYPTSCATTGFTVNTANWACAAVDTDATGNPRFWFTPTGCTAMWGSGDIFPTTAAQFGTDPMPKCTNTAATLAPGAQLSVTLPLHTTATATSGSGLPVIASAHGASSGAWSNPITSYLQVVNTATASAGFTQVAAHGSTLTAVGSPPSTSTDAAGSADFVYTITNTGAVPITGATITIPGTDSVGNSGITGGSRYWQVTAVSLTGSTYGCTATWVAPTTPGNTNGAIQIAGAGCSVPSNGALTVQFTSATPAIYNDTFNFPTTVNSASGSSTASPTGSGMQTMQLTISASISLSLNPTMQCSATNANNSTVTPNPTTLTLDFGGVANNSTTTCRQAVEISISTSAVAPSHGWDVYASIQANPATTGTPPSGLTNEAAIAVSSTGNTDPALTYGATSWTALPTLTGTAGFHVSWTTNGPSTGGTAHPGSPYNTYVDLQVGIGSEATTQQTQNLVFTWIYN